MKKLLFCSFCILLLFSISASSCKKDGIGQVCTECTATITGMTTSPDKYCGSESDVKNHETNYISQNQAVGATAKCTRK